MSLAVVVPSSPRSPLDEDGLPIISLHGAADDACLVTPVKPAKVPVVVEVEAAAMPSPSGALEAPHAHRSGAWEAAGAAAAPATAADATAPTVMSVAKRAEAARAGGDEPLLVEVRVSGERRPSRVAQRAGSSRARARHSCCVRARRRTSRAL
jgi:hypothetical protein